MTALAQSDVLAEHAFLLGDAVDVSSLPEAARRLLETRLMAAVFRRRWPLLIHWRRQSLARRPDSPRNCECGDSSTPAVPLRAATNDELAVVSDLPRQLPVVREEIAMLRAFLSCEINAILFDETS